MLLEDAVALYLHILAKEEKLGLHYDAQTGVPRKGGADFILKGKSVGVVVEVSWGKKGSRQVIKTMKKTGISCGIVVYNGH